jgi:hypothetical protein
LFVVGFAFSRAENRGFFPTKFMHGNNLRGNHMGNIHRATGDNGVQFKYQEPSANSKGETKGILYEKKDSKTGEIKLKSASGFGGNLLMKLRGYSEANYKTCGDFLSAKFPGAGGAFRADVFGIKRHVSHTSSVIPVGPFNEMMKTTQANRDFAEGFLQEIAAHRQKQL